MTEAENPDEAETLPPAEPQFGLPGCTCRPWGRYGNQVFFLSPSESVELIAGWEIREDCPLHASPKPELSEEGERLSDLVGRELLVQARIEALKIANERTSHLSVGGEMMDLAKQYEEWILRESSTG
jgi:hypothetical protein